MKWSEIIDCIASDMGQDVSAKVDALIRSRFGGERVTITDRPIITSEMIENAAPGRPRQAARMLGIHPSTAYRTIRRTKLIR